jgi:putative transposase
VVTKLEKIRRVDGVSSSYRRLAQFWGAWEIISLNAESARSGSLYRRDLGPDIVGANLVFAQFVPPKRGANTRFAPTGPMQVVDSKEKQAKNRRRSIRLKGWDYSQEGVYFITLCTRNREYLFGEIVDGMMNFNASGEMVTKTWEGLPERFSFLELGTKVVMPNHFHAIAIINRRGESCIRLHGTSPENVINLDEGDRRDQGERKVRPYGKRPQGTPVGSIGRIVQVFKSLTTHQYIRGVRDYGWPPFLGKLWQRNYFEHIVRDEEEWQRIHDYIAANPINWAMDRENREVEATKSEEPWQV